MRPQTAELIEHDTGRLLVINQAKSRRTYQCSRYWLDAVTTDWGRGFALSKVTVDGLASYSVLLDGDLSFCDCMGFYRHGHCKHVASLLNLAKEGKL